jgi:hypothetical protein
LLVKSTCRTWTGYCSILPNPTVATTSRAFHQKIQITLSTANFTRSVLRRSSRTCCWWWHNLIGWLARKVMMVGFCRNSCTVTTPPQGTVSVAIETGDRVARGSDSRETFAGRAVPQL